MKLKLLTVLLFLLGLNASAQTHIYPAQDTNNTFTGSNAFKGPVSLPNLAPGCTYIGNNGLVTTVACGGNTSFLMPLSGGTFTGPVTLFADPTTSMQPTTKQYVDTINATLTAALGTKANQAIFNGDGTLCLRNNGSAQACGTSSGGNGTVTSYSFNNASGNPLFNSSVSNPTTTPSVTLTLIAQAANCVFAGPASGASANPVCRALVSADIPALSYDALGAATTAQANSLQKANNLSDLASASSARTNLGLGSAATASASAFDPAGAANAAQAAAQSYSSNASNLNSGTVPAAQLSGVNLAQALSTGGMFNNNLVADYDFRANGSLVDISGNTTALTMPNGTPTYSPVDHAYVFGSSAILQAPSSVNQLGAVEMDLELPPPGFTQTYCNAPSAVMGGSGSYQSGGVLITDGACGQYYGFAYYPYNGTTGLTNGGSSRAPTGHVLMTVIFGTSSTNGIVIINGQVDTLANWIQNGGNTNALGSGQYYMIGGGVPLGGFRPFLGKMHRIRFFGPSTTLTSDQAIADQRTMYLSDSALFGIPTTAPALVTPGQFLLVDGTSIEAGYGATAVGSQGCFANLTIGTAIGSTTCSVAWSNQVSTQKYTYTPLNFGIYNTNGAQIINSTPWRDATLCSSGGAGRNVAVLGALTNDFYSSPSTALSAWQKAASWVGIMKQAGCIVAVSTGLSRGDNPNADAAKNAYNILVRQNAKAVGADFLVDNDDPIIMADGAYANPANFGDKVHPLTPGQAAMALAFSNAHNAFFGSTVSNPTLVASTVNSTSAFNGGAGYASAPTITFNGGSCSVVPVATTTLSSGAATTPVFSTAGTCEKAPTMTFVGGSPTTAATATAALTSVTAYAMTSGDTYTRVVCSANCTVTLPNGLGATGADYRVNNVSGSGITVTLKTLNSSQPLNNTDLSSTGMTIPNNTTVTIRDAANQPNTGGMHWEM